MKTEKNGGKKILIASTYFWPYLSGLTLYPERLAKSWQVAGYQVSALSFQHDPKTPLDETHNGIKIHRIKPHFQVSKGMINCLYFAYAWKEVAKNDLIIVNLPSLENFWVSLIAKLLGKKTVVIYHCDVDFRYNWLMQLIGLITNISSGFSCLLADRIINSSKDYAQSSWVLKPFLKKVVYAYPPIEKLAPNKSYAKQLKLFYGHKEPLVGFVGRISREKNLETLVLALAILKKKYPKIKFLCAGPYAFQVAGESKYYLKILQMLHDYEIDFDILGILSPTQLVSFFQYIDLLVLPSNTRTEAFGMVQAEAMVNNTPVVVVNRPGIRVPVKLSRMGELFESNNPEDLAKKIEQVYKKKATYRKHRKEAEKLFVSPGFKL